MVGVPILCLTVQWMYRYLRCLETACQVLLVHLPERRKELDVEHDKMYF
jgi:hypothetical protein